MVHKSMLLCLALAVLSSTACGQDPASSQQTVAVQALEELRQQNRELAARVARLEANLKALTDEQLDYGQRLAQIAKQGQNGEYFPYVNANNDAAKKHFVETVKTTAPPTGTLTIVNKMSRDQVLWVNDKPHAVPAGGNVSIEVPRGTIATRLQGQDPVNWTIGAPDYVQSIDIRPRDVPAPQTGWTTSPPPGYVIVQ